jgi:hypothetical protein
MKSVCVRVPSATRKCYLLKRGDLARSHTAAVSAARGSALVLELPNDPACVDLLSLLMNTYVQMPPFGMVSLKQ